MKVAIRLEFPDERAADVIRWPQAAPEGVSVYLVTHGQPKKNAPVDAAQAAQLTDSEV